MGFPRQEYWSGLPSPPPGVLSDPGMEPRSPALAGGSLITSATWEALTCLLGVTPGHIEPQATFGGQS